MCRHAAYVGPAPGITLDQLCLSGDHSLLHQSYLARELLTGTVCADGHGVAWYDTGTRPEPARYTCALPIWADTNLPSFAPVVWSCLAIAQIRNATEAGTTSEANCHPFVDGCISFSHNGYLDDFAGSWRHWMTQEIAPGRLARLRGMTDSEHLFQLLLTYLDEDEAPASDDLALPRAIQRLLRTVAERAEAAGLLAQLNLLVSDGRQLVATRFAAATPQANSLYLLSDGDDHPDGHLVASEPFDQDPLWSPVAEGTVLVLDAGAPPVRLGV
ncbi:MAG: class II glutamine amidotransferase [Thermoplasmatota archaeon]